MPRDPEFAWTGPLPEIGYVGFVNLKVESDGVVFSVRSEGSSHPTAYKIPRDVAYELLSNVLVALG
jgi:hypothetical protein